VLVGGHGVCKKQYNFISVVTTPLIRVEVDKLKKVLNKYHEGYTIERANIGAWHGVEEESSQSAHI
jgi:hypothetical protein